MRLFKWHESNAVFVSELDDEHREIFQTVGELERALASQAPAFQIQEVLHRLIACTEDHFTHEEKLMKGFRYELLDWHKKQHDTVRKRMKEYTPQIEAGDADAGSMLTEFLKGWLYDHTAVTDKMMGAFLRNQQRASHIA